MDYYSLHQEDDEEDRERRVMAHLIEARKKLGVPIRNITFNPQPSPPPHLSLQNRANTCPLPFPQQASSSLSEEIIPFDQLDPLSPPSPPPSRPRNRTGSLFPPAPSVQERRSALRASSFNGTSSNMITREHALKCNLHQVDQVEYIDEEDQDGANSVFGASSDAASSSLPTTIPSLSFSQSSSISVDEEDVDEEDDKEQVGETTLEQVENTWRDGFQITVPQVGAPLTVPSSPSKAATPSKGSQKSLPPLSLKLKLPNLPSALQATSSDLLAELSHRDSRSKVLAWTQGWREWEWGCETQKQSQTQMSMQEPNPPALSRSGNIFWAL